MQVVRVKPLVAKPYGFAAVDRRQANQETRPNPSLRGTATGMAPWPARPSFIIRRAGQGLPGVSPSAQTLGSRFQTPVLASAVRAAVAATECPSSLAAGQFASTRAANLFGFAAKALAVLALPGSPGAPARSNRLHSASRCRPLQRWLFGRDANWCSRALSATPSRRAAARRERVSKQQQVRRRVAVAHRIGASAAAALVIACSAAALAPSKRLLPQPLRRGTATGKAPGPRTGQCHHPPARAKRLPGVSPQLKR